MMRGRYYFVVYECTRWSWPESGTSSMHTEKYQDVVDVHPIRFQLDCNEKYGHEQPESAGGGRFKEDYKVIFYSELTHAEYKEFRGMVG